MRLFATLLALAGFVAIIVAHNRESGAVPSEPSVQQVRLKRDRFFGREAFIPDWSRAETIDREATRTFIRDWLPRLPGCDRASGHQSDAPAGIAFQAVDYWRDIRPNFVPATRDRVETRTLFAARGESEPLAFAVRASASTRVKMHVARFESGDEMLPEHVTSVRVALPYRARVQPKRDTRTELKSMVLLAPGEQGWDLPAHCTTVFIVDVHAPTDAKPGSYRTAVTLSTAAGVAHTIPLELEVLPFTLKVNGFNAGAFGVTFNQWAGGFTGYYPEMIEMDSRYGFNIAGGFFNKGNELPFRRSADGSFHVDETDSRFARFDQTMSELHRYGMGDVLFWNWGASGKVAQFDRVLEHAGVGAPVATAEGKAGFAEMMRAIKTAEAMYGWPEMVINPFDEALKDQDATRELIEAAAAVYARSPETRLYMTEWRPGYTRHYQSSGRHLRGKGRPRDKAYAALVDSGERPRRNFAVIGANTLDEEGRSIQDALGGEYWHYTGATRLAANTRFAFGFRPWIQRSEAVLMWANYKGQLDGRGWTLHYVLQSDPRGRERRNTRGQVIPSSRALTVREGIDDRKYIETLRFYATHKGSGEDLRYLARLQTRARQLLVNQQRMGGLDNVEGQVSDGAALQALRIEIKDRILALLPE